MSFLHPGRVSWRAGPEKRPTRERGNTRLERVASQLEGPARNYLAEGLEGPRRALGPGPANHLAEGLEGRRRLGLEGLSRCAAGRGGRGGGRGGALRTRLNNIE